MNIDLNGAVINGITNVSESVLGKEFIVFWDEKGLPIHIRKHIVTQLYVTLNPTPNNIFK